MPKIKRTNAERCKEYRDRMRKKKAEALINSGILPKKKKSNAQCCKEYRERCKKKQAEALSNPESVYKRCFVPRCKSSSNKYPQKIFFSVPSSAARRKVWCAAAGCKNLHSYQYACEDHFNLPDDIENFHEWQTTGAIKKLKSNVIPRPMPPVSSGTPDVVLGPNNPVLLSLYKRDSDGKFYRPFISPGSSAAAASGTGNVDTVPTAFVAVKQEVEDENQSLMDPLARNSGVKLEPEDEVDESGTELDVGAMFAQKDDPENSAREFTQSPDLDLFGSYVANKLKLVNRTQSVIAEKVIAEVLMRANLGTLEESTRLTDSKGRPDG